MFQTELSVDWQKEFNISWPLIPLLVNSTDEEHLRGFEYLTFKSNKEERASC